MATPASGLRIAPILSAMILGALAGMGPASAAEEAASGNAVAGDPAVSAAEPMPQAAQSLVLDLVQTRNGFAAVGERGNILLSDDGQHWTQVADVPTRSTLNAVAAVGEDLWAGGHDGVILHSPDAGASWERQRVEVWTADAIEPSAGAPVLDLLFVDARHGYAVGAYSLLLETTDGGKTWEHRSLPPPPDIVKPAQAKGSGAAADSDAWTFSEEDLELEAVGDPHLNAIARTQAGELFIVAERGVAFRSRDEGRSWERIVLPYGGSMFGVLAWGPGHVLAFGLQGRAFETHDLGQSWTELPTGLRSMLMGGQALPEGGALLVGAQGAVLSRAGPGEPFAHAVFVNGNSETPILAGLLGDPQAGYIVFGERGLDRYHAQ